VAVCLNLGVNPKQVTMLMATSPLAMLALTDDPVQQLLTAHAYVGRTWGFEMEHLPPASELLSLE